MPIDYLSNSDNEDDISGLPPELLQLLRGGNPYISDNRSIPNVATPPFLPGAPLRNVLKQQNPSAADVAPVPLAHPAARTVLGSPGVPDQTGDGPGLSLRDRIVSGLGNAVRSGVDAMATPNFAYGGPTDVARAAQAGMQGQEGRSLQQRAIARQKISDDLARQKTEADIARSNAEGAMYGAHTKAYESLAGQREDIHKDDREVDPHFAQQNLPWVVPDAGGKYYVPKTVFNTLAKPTKPPSTDRKGEVPVSEAFAKETFPGVMPDENGRFWVPSSVYAQTMKDPKAQQPIVHGSQVDENGNGTAFWIDQDQQKHVIDLGHVGKPARPAPDPNATKSATPNQFRMVEKTKQDRLSAIDKETDSRIKKEATDELGTYDDQRAQQIYGEAADKKNQVQQAYLNEIQALKPDFDPSQAQQAIAAPTASAHPAARANAIQTLNTPAAVATPAVQTPTTPNPAAASQAARTLTPPTTNFKAPAKPEPITFHKEKLPGYVQQNNAARQAKGLPPLTIDQTKRALESQNFQVQ